ncbi:MAG: hypothetical protein II937_05365 [Bacteroidales bacterium]|nr:hypothetical protein [Bacteroidales bacterium]
MGRRRLIFKILGIFIILNIFFQYTFAQSKHVSIWSIGNYIIDFNKKPVKPEAKDDIFCSLLYTDSDGKIQLIEKFDILYDGNNEQIEDLNNIFEDHDNTSFFVPSPIDNKMVYLFRGKQYVLIDIIKKK